ncbi:MAG: acid phosphatase [Rudaea sp.]
MRRILLSATISLTLAACQSAPPERSSGAPRAAAATASVDAIKTIVVIYAENRAFDNLYGNFPGANGLQQVTAEQALQTDRDGKPLPTLPPVPGKGLTDPSDPVEITSEMTAGHANAPFALDDPKGYDIGLDFKLHDLVHAFYQNQMQINGGRNDKFAAYSDAGGLVMGHFDGSKMALWQIAKKYTLADNFFQGGFGGSFFNHQYLICACAPIDYQAKNDPHKYHDAISVLNPDGVSLKLDPETAESAVNGPPRWLHYGVLTPDFYAVNTMQPPYQPSASLAPKGGDWRFADTDAVNTLTPQLLPTIGDRLSNAKVGWAWYGGGWKSAIVANEALRKYLDGKGGEAFNFPDAAAGGVTMAHVQFQYHHQPFNYYANFAPGRPARAEHLRDGGLDGVKFLADIDAGKLPPVTFYKPQGSQNQHAGYATIAAGDAHIASVIAHLERSPQWPNMLVVITYDENGGWWDHAAPPKGDRWGPGTRIPALIISPFAKRGYVDHTQYDTGSIQRLINHRFNLPPLPGIEQRDAALRANGQKPMGDLTDALILAH